MSNIAGIYYNDTAAAPGICVSVYLSGCPLHCEGCHNPEAQDRNYGEPLTDEYIDKIVSSICLNNVYRKLCILGGEPLSIHNIDATKKIIDACKEVYPELEVYIWTGYTYEQLFQIYGAELGINTLMSILFNTTCLIDGPYVQELRDITLKMRGSKNQRLIDVPKSLELKRAVEME